MLGNTVNGSIRNTIPKKQILGCLQNFLYILFSDLALIHFLCPVALSDESPILLNVTNSLTFINVSTEVFISCST